MHIRRLLLHLAFVNSYLEFVSIVECIRAVNLNCYLSPVSLSNVRRLPAQILLLVAETTQRWVVDLVYQCEFDTLPFLPTVP